MGLDLAIDADLAGVLRAGFGDLAKKLDLLRSDLADRIPVPVEISGQVTGPASGAIVVPLNPNTPPQGTLWHVKSVRIAGASGALSAPAGTLLLYVGAGMGTAADATQADVAHLWRDSTTNTFPQRGFYDDFELTVSFGQKLYGILTGATSGTIYEVTATAKQVRLSPPAPVVQGV